ncbi:MAG: hypothetical protein GY699_12670 [Desulfobacteraceae bacterium]|nr:hypothetical protein [Desulfobacteraceae bacterium]
MLITTSWVEKVKELIGLEAVSPVWGEKPAWYFWISQTLGAYYLELSHIHDEPWENDRLACGAFKVKCYPYANKEVFNNFSFEEQSFVKSALFDHTNTPKFDQKDKIPDSLFNVAALELTIDSTDSIALFSLGALDSMQIYHAHKNFQSYPEINKEKVYRAGEKASDVPGYDLGYPLFSSLLSLYSFYSKTKPVRVLLTSSPGFKYVCNSPEKKDCIDTDDTILYSLNVLFSDNSDKNTANENKLIKQRFKEPDCTIIFDQKFSFGQLPYNYIFPFVNNALDEKWWSLATANYKSDLTSTCGCEDCHH